MPENQRGADGKGRGNGKAKGTGAEAFNESAANGQEKRKTKAQVLAMLVSRLPMKGGTDNEYMTREGERMAPTKNQKALMREFAAKDVVMTTGSAGTGKTVWACLTALQALVAGTHNGIIINAPAVDSGEDIGFRPGNTDDKMLSYINQIYENFDEWVGEDLRMELCQVGLIKIVPNADMRGRSFKKKMIIFDESQNASGKSLMTAFSRLGAGSNAIYLGDDNQNDRTSGQSAYEPFMDRFARNPEYQKPRPDRGIRGIGYVEMSTADIKRHPLLQLAAELGDDKPLAGHANHRQERKMVNERPSQAPAPANDTAASAAVVSPVSAPKPV